MFVHKISGNKTVACLILATTSILALSACGKTETGMSTAERVKRVEDKQNAADVAMATPPSPAPTSAQVAPSKASAAMR